MYNLSREIIFKNDLIVRNTAHLSEAVNLPIKRSQTRSFPCFLFVLQDSLTLPVTMKAVPPNPQNLPVYTYLR